MKIAIHHIEKNSISEYWINYCEKKKIDYKIVNCFDNIILQNIRDCEGIMFNFHLGDKASMLFGKQLLFALESNFKKVFPDFNTMWHYDDKVGQKYLLESVSAPLIPTYVFYQKEKALNWANTVQYPKVFKLRNGAGSSNVKLVKSKSHAISLINQAFGKGFSHQRNQWEYLKENWRKYNLDKKKFGGVKSAVKRLFYVPTTEKKHGVEQGYVYFQEFIPNNDHDIRIVIIGDKGYGFKRKVRKNDFRASGSGEFDFRKESIPLDCIKIGFETSKKLGLQSAAYDFVINIDNSPLIVEVSYIFASSGNYKKCEGYWDDQMNWYAGEFNPYGWMVEVLIGEINEKK
jgi:glutathione synthase/RimK-type ligase-like ATP-grasp enzyme